jgi:hypothetical protein
MLLVALKPPHPAAKRHSTGNAASRKAFQFNLIATEYKVTYAIGNN